LIANRNIVIQGEAGEGEEVEGEAAQEGVLNEIEKFRQRQAVRDKEKDDERRRELKRKLEETSRQERANVSRIFVEALICYIRVCMS
jgi:predicted secreted Zn-dependent protease